MKRKYNNRQSALAKRISSWFKSKRNENLSFGAILDKYCEPGMSRRYVANFLMDMRGKDGSTLRSVINIKDTSLWEAWKSELAQGRCEFIFYSKFTGNPYHGNKGLTRTLKVKHKDMARLPIKYHCDKCENTTTKLNPVSKAPRYLIALKGHMCPYCNQYGTSTGTFTLEGIVYKKTIEDDKEIFVKI